MTLKQTFDSTPSIVKWPIIVGLAIILTLFLIFRGQTMWNGIGNKIFEWKIGKKQTQVQKELDDAAKIKAELEQSYKDLKQAKEDRASAIEETDRLKGIFNDSSKTSADKVAEFKKAISDSPTHTPTDNITNNDLCERAKSIGASAETITALCQQ
jgi:F0F1-type ATP synthase membrane subunit b/b'